MQMNDSLQKQFPIHVTLDEFRVIVKESLKEILSETNINSNTLLFPSNFLYFFIFYHLHRIQ